MTADDPASGGAMPPEMARLLCNAATVVLGRVQLARRRLRRDAECSGLEGDLAAIEAAARDLAAMLARRVPSRGGESPDA